MPWTILGLAVAALVLLNVVVVLLIGTASRLDERRRPSDADLERERRDPRSDFSA